MMCVRRVNTPLRNELAASSRRSDRAMQEIQKMIVKTGQVLSTITDKVLVAKKRKEDIKPRELLQPISDALSFVGHQLHPLKGKFQLASWILSGESSQIEAFRLGLLASFVNLGHREHS